MKRAIVGVFIICVGLVINSCNTTEPPPPNGEKPTLELKLEDVSCTEAWIELTTTNLQLPATIQLKKDTTVAQDIILSNADTLLYVDSLLPNQNFTFIASHSGLSGISSNELGVITLDTTSHNFTFETFTFGGTAGSSTLYDVAIINENNIWAVGEILIADTSQNGYTLYNAVRWDGSQWELKRIPFLYQGDSLFGPIYSVFAFDSSDIWFGIGSMIHWNGVNYISISTASVFPSIVNKIWGSSSNNLYVVGNNGKIVWYNGTRWSSIESGTDLNIYDIWGEYNSSKSEYEIVFVAAQQYVGPDRKIYRIVDNSVEELSTMNINQGSIHGIWFRSGRKYYVVGNGIYFKSNIYDNNDWNTSLHSLTPYYTYAIRGSGLNNIFICGSYGELLHFGGASWRSFKNTPGFFDADFFNVDVKTKIVAVVGQRFNSGFVIIGRVQ